MQNFDDTHVNAQDEFLIDHDTLGPGYKQFMQSELRRTVSTLCVAVQNERSEPDAPIAAPLVQAAAGASGRQASEVLDPHALHVLPRRKMKWPLLQRTVFSNGVSY